MGLLLTVRLHLPLITTYTNTTAPWARTSRYVAILYAAFITCVIRSSTADKYPMLRLFFSGLPSVVAKLSQPTGATRRLLHWRPRDDTTLPGLIEALSELSTVPPGRPGRPSFPFPAVANTFKDKPEFTLNTLNPERLTAKDLITLTRPMPCFDISLSSSFQAFTEISALIDGRTSKESSEEPKDSSPDLSPPRAGLSGSQRPTTLLRAVELLASTSRRSADGLYAEVFPEGFGFLYYYTPPPHLPRLAGELRFRHIAPLGHDPRTWRNHTLREAFRKGFDHTLTNGLTWRVPLWSTGWARKYALVRAMLVHEGLVAEETMDAAVILGEKHNLHRYRSRVICSFHEPFLISFATRALTFHFLSDEKIKTYHLWDLCTRRQDIEQRTVQPFHGTCLNETL